VLAADGRIVVTRRGVVVPPAPGGTLTALTRAEHAVLHGRAGGVLLAGRRAIGRAAPVRPRPVRTTLSERLQRAAVAALGASYGGVAVLRPSDGAVLALAGIASSAPQPPGSTFKIVTTTAALQAHVTSLGRSYPLADGATIDGFRLANARGETCGGTLLNAFAVSCNSVFAPLGVRVGARRLVATARRFGFDEPAPIPFAARSTIPSARTIGDRVAVAASAIGQGRVQTTPLEMASVAATIAERGVRARPRILASARVRRVRVTTPAVARELDTLMRAVVSYGTGTAAQIAGVTVAGKTGTAELSSDLGTPSTNPKDSDAWFVAYAPAERPRVAVGVMLVGAGFGGASAAPIARQVLEAALGL
jgi:cell division protein FtsI/penicillin-binding protein 2